MVSRQRWSQSRSRTRAGRSILRGVVKCARTRITVTWTWTWTSWGRRHDGLRDGKAPTANVRPARMSFESADQPRTTDSTEPVNRQTTVHAFVVFDSTEGVEAPVAGHRSFCAKAAEWTRAVLSKANNDVTCLERVKWGRWDEFICPSTAAVFFALYSLSCLVVSIYLLVSQLGWFFYFRRCARPCAVVRTYCVVVV